MKPIAVFYHCLFGIGEPWKELPASAAIVDEQMRALRDSGLLDSTSELVVGINGGKESEDLCDAFLPEKAKRVFHGLQSRSENRTILLMEEFAKTHPSWYLLYHHAKSSTHHPDSAYGIYATKWRRCMQRHCVLNWRRAVSTLDRGFEACGCHWLTGMGHDHSQHYFAGTFYWVTSDFFATIPSMTTRERLKISGIDSLESRYEAEVHLGNGPRLPRVLDLEQTHGLGGCP